MHHHRYLMRDQVRDQIRSIMGEEDTRLDRRTLSSHLFATGVLAFCYALLLTLSR
jgi:hypothetical protein